jgi:signal transduction histidine kinase
MGLGVFLAATVVEQCGGRLQLDSRPGDGTTVTITLPTCTQGPT